MLVLKVVLVLFSIFITIPFGKQSKEYDNDCPEVDDKSCFNPRSVDSQGIESNSSCRGDEDCRAAHKCCRTCQYNSLHCIKTHVNNDENLKNTYCPQLKPCYTPLLYEPKYRCGSDENCLYGYKCCRSDCYIHKVCVIPVDKEENEIIITTNESNGPGNQFTDDNEGTIIPSTISTAETTTTSFPPQAKTTTPTLPPTFDFTDEARTTKGSGSGDGFTDDYGGSGSGDGTTDDDEDNHRQPLHTTTVPPTQEKTATTSFSFEFIDDTTVGSGSGDGSIGDDEDNRRPSTALTGTPATHGTITEGSGSLNGFTDDFGGSGSGDGTTDDDEDNHRQPSPTSTVPPMQEKTTTATTSSSFESIDDTTVGSGSGDGSNGDAEDNRRPSTALTGTPATHEAITDGSGSGNGFTDDEDHQDLYPPTLQTSTLPSPATVPFIHEGSAYGEGSGSGDGSNVDREDSTFTVTTAKSTKPHTGITWIDDEDVTGFGSGRGSGDFAFIETSQIVTTTERYINKATTKSIFSEPPLQISPTKETSKDSLEGSASGNWSTEMNHDFSGSGYPDDEDLTVYTTSAPKEWVPEMDSTGKPNVSDKEVDVGTTKTVIDTTQVTGEAELVITVSTEKSDSYATDSKKEDDSNNTAVQEDTEKPSEISKDVDTSQKEKPINTTVSHESANNEGIKESIETMKEEQTSKEHPTSLTAGLPESTFEEDFHSSKQEEPGKDNINNPNPNSDILESEEQEPKEYEPSINSSHSTGLPDSATNEIFPVLKEEPEKDSGFGDHSSNTQESDEPRSKESETSLNSTDATGSPDFTVKEIGKDTVSADTDSNALTLEEEKGKEYETIPSSHPSELPDYSFKEAFESLKEVNEDGSSESDDFYSDDESYDLDWRFLDS